MQVGGTRIVVMAFVFMIVSVTENQSGSRIHNESNDRDEDGLIESNIYGEQHAFHTFPCHDHREDSKQTAPVNPPQRIHLSHTEAESLVVGKTPGKDVSEG